VGRLRSPSRRGLLLSLFLLVVLLAAVDLVRGRDSLLRSWFGGLGPTPQESARGFLEDFRKSRRR